MRKGIKVEFEVRVPENTTIEDTREWVAFHTGYSGSMKISNSLIDTELDAITGSLFVREIY